MKSINFEYMRQHRPELASLGGFAEAYAHSDPESALTKLRIFCEQVVDAVYEDLHIAKISGAPLIDQLDDSEFRRHVPQVIRTKLHALRRYGNKGAHAGKEKPTTDRALWLIKEAWDVSNYLLLTHDDGSLPTNHKFFDVPEGGVTEVTKAKLKDDKRELKIQLSEQEQQIAQLLVAVEAEKAKKAAAEAAVTKTQAELEALWAEKATASTKVLDILAFNEEETRRHLIDEMLADAGWDVQTQDTEQVKREVEVPDASMASGLTYADYVLFGDKGEPLAVIEAKRASKDAKLGQEQAHRYADGLEKKYGHRPVIFFTNGGETSIWDDHKSQKYPPRRVYGFYAKASLEHLIFQRTAKKPLKGLAVDGKIVDRDYQIEAIKRVTERLEERFRAALIVQATGSGKTRVAVALTDVLLRANWAKRILFLCDRIELRRQADKAFGEFLAGQPRAYVSAAKALDGDKRLYLSTYPAMMKAYKSLDVGFFDVVIIDESHRSIYKTYGEVLSYFDCLKVGLTATPVSKIDRNTFNLFACEPQHPTMNYPLKQAIEEKHLVGFSVQTVTTNFQRNGMRYVEMSEAAQESADEQLDDASTLDVDAADVDRQIFNKDSNRHILRNLMEHGIRDGTNTRPGKSIVFARSHKHAELLAELFNEMYPKYGGAFCKVIDSHDTRASQLIDDFKDNENDLTIAISVDMLDTGIDVPEVVNLVFAKPVKSYVKFQQMIGRGTRLCLDLFGPGEDKTEFLIFDHWGNFKWFEEKGWKEVDKKPARSLMEQLFEARLDLMKAAIDKMEAGVQAKVVKLLEEDVVDLEDTEAIAVKEKWKTLKTYGKHDVLAQFAANTEAQLRTVVAPLMQWRNVRGREAACRFDLLLARTETARLMASGTYADLRGDVQNELNALPKVLNQVKAKVAILKKAEPSTFWDTATFDDLEEVRQELRGVLKYKPKGNDGPKPPVLIVDILDGGVERKTIVVKLDGQELVAYREKVEHVLTSQFEENQTLLKIKAGEAVDELDLDQLRNLVLQYDQDVDIRSLLVHHPEFCGHLDIALRSIVGVDQDTVDKHFGAFLAKHQTNMNANQVGFLRLLKGHISKFGIISIDQLFEQPFTTFHSDGVDGVFPDKGIADELLDLITPFQPPKPDDGQEASA